MNKYHPNRLNLDGHFLIEAMINMKRLNYLKEVTPILQILNNLSKKLVCKDIFFSNHTNQKNNWLLDHMTPHLIGLCIKHTSKRTLSNCSNKWSDLNLIFCKQNPSILLHRKAFQCWNMDQHITTLIRWGSFVFYPKMLWLSKTSFHDPCRVFFMNAVDLI